jgi:signal transduction histidine kinase
MAAPSQTPDPLPSAAAPGVPEPGFSRQRSFLRALLVAAVLIPCTYVVVIASSDMRDREAAARDTTVRTARAAEEHALKVFDLDETLDARIAERVQSLDNAALNRDEADVHEALGNMGGGYPQVASISIFGPDGMLLADSLYYPVPHASIAEREDFTGIRDGRLMAHISRVAPGPLKLDAEPVFRTGAARLDQHGHFAGIVSISLRSAYFNAFYRDLLGEDTPMSLMLMRTDGAQLAAWPPQAEVPLPASSAVPASAAVGRDAVMRVNNAIVAYRQVGTYPVYVACAYPISALWNGWRQRLKLLLVTMFGPSVALWFVIGLSLRRLRAEEQAWGRWRAEASIRHSLEEAYRQARKMEALGSLVGNVAHDFNNLLMIISSHAQVLRRLGDASLTPDLTAIERALSNGQSLTRQLLGVARRQPLRKETIDLANRLESGSASLRALLGTRAELWLDLPPGLWPVNIDTAELDLALINLILNARDAMPHGGQIQIRARNLELRPADGFALSGEFVQLTVQDSGTGMSPEVLARSAEPLFTTKPKGAGTGLGLPQVFAFCERSGGLASIDSNPGEGTSVTLYLPRTHQQPVSPPMPATRPTSRANDSAARPGLRILLVEDEPEVAAGTGALLEVMGHRVSHLPNADAAVERLYGSATATRNEFDVVISDVSMPGTLSGIDLAERLAREPDAPPVILVTGYAAELDRIATARTRVLSKPFDIAVLEQVLDELFDRHETRHPNATQL